MTKHCHSVFFLIPLLFYPILSLYPLDFLAEGFVEAFDSNAGGGISLSISETMRDNLSLDGHLTYIGSSSYDAGCLFYYTLPFFEAGGGFCYKLENTLMYPGISLAVIVSPDWPVTFNAQASLFYKAENLLKLQGFEIKADGVIHLANSDTKLTYTFWKEKDTSKMKNTIRMEIEAFQEGIPFRIILFGDVALIKEEDITVQSQAGTTFLWQTKKAGTYLLGAKAYLTGKDYGNMPNYVISAGIRLSME